MLTNVFCFDVHFLLTTETVSIVNTANITNVENSSIASNNFTKRN